MAQWLDAQDPKVISRLRTLNPGQAPTAWADYTTPTGDSAPSAAVAHVRAM
jgi:hypothetical protein